jgi:putative ABC transport system substrate-binding protein
MRMAVLLLFLVLAPFERPTHFKMAINNKVAHSIGITIPPSVYVRADEVIE